MTNRGINNNIGADFVRRCSIYVFEVRVSVGLYLNEKIDKNKLMEFEMRCYQRILNVTL